MFKKKKTGHHDWVMEHVVMYVRKYIDAVANSGKLRLYLRYDFYNIIFKIK